MRKMQEQLVSCVPAACLLQAREKQRKSVCGHSVLTLNVASVLAKKERKSATGIPWAPACLINDSIHATLNTKCYNAGHVIDETRRAASFTDRVCRTTQRPSTQKRLQT